ncbi:MAG: DUF2225 domain-containing protein [Vallitalea sp.]|jgi:uncharacterized protein (DUF2225 family)|nr:DUF2225 domain-containing protein [Vallitalea sp.]
MSDIFSGLEKLGFQNTKEIKLFEEEKKNKTKSVREKQQKMIKDILYDRKLICPVCGEDINIRSVKAGKAKLLSSDLDLRPKYDIITPYLYDVILCNCCGYAALSRFFSKITRTQASWIKNQISTAYKGRFYPEEYTFEMAIERYKLALLNSVVKKAKDSEKAYICLKLAWLYRSVSEEIMTNDNYDKQKLKENNDYERAFVEKAYVGFVSAYEKESFPVCGMNEITVTYLIGELSRRLGKNDESLRWISKVIISKNANDRLKNKARDVKDLIKNNNQN